MKEFLVLLTFINFFFSCDVGKNNIKESKLSLKAVLKGTHYYLGKDSIHDPCGKYIYYLVEVKLINNADSTIEFLAYNCSTARNVVVDTKEIINCVNSCTANYPLIIELKAKQEFSIPVILKSKNEVDKKIKIGFILLSPKNVGSDKVFLTLYKSIENLENVLWSDPINLGLNYGKPYEIK